MSANQVRNWWPKPKMAGLALPTSEQLSTLISSETCPTAAKDSQRVGCSILIQEKNGDARLITNCNCHDYEAFMGYLSPVSYSCMPYTSHLIVQADELNDRRYSWVDEVEIGKCELHFSATCVSALLSCFVILIVFFPCFKLARSTIRKFTTIKK